MVEEIKEELEEKGKEAKEKTKKRTVFERVPAFYKILAIIFLWVVWTRIENKSQIIWYIVGAALVIYFLGQRPEDEYGDLSPVEAKKLVRKEIEYMKAEGEIEKSTQYKVGPICTIKIHNNEIKYYLIEVTFYHNTGEREYKAAKVNITNRYVYIEDVVADRKITGKEIRPTKIILGKDLKFAQQHKLLERLFR